MRDAADECRKLTKTTSKETKMAVRNHRSDRKSDVFLCPQCGGVMSWWRGSLFVSAAVGGKDVAIEERRESPFSR